MKTEGSVDIARPLQEVFDYTLGNTPEWSLIVVSDEMIEETPDGAGSTFRVVTEERGNRMEFEGVVTRHDPPRTHAFHMKGPQFDIEAEYLFEDLGEGTRVTQKSLVLPKGFLKVFFALFGWLMKKSSGEALDKELANLKRLLEQEEGSEPKS